MNSLGHNYSLWFFHPPLRKMTATTKPAKHPALAFHRAVIAAVCNRDLSVRDCSFARIFYSAANNTLKTLIGR